MDKKDSWSIPNLQMPNYAAMFLCVNYGSDLEFINKTKGAVPTNYIPVIIRDANHLIGKKKWHPLALHCINQLLGQW